MISFFFAVSSLTATIVFWLIVAEILIFILFLPLHRWILRKINKSKQDLVKEVDEVIYLLAKSQYESHISKQQLGGDPHFAMMKEMFKSGSFEYLDNVDAIKNLVGKIQQLINVQIVTDEQRTRVAKIQKKMKIQRVLSKIFGIPICVFTLGIYKLFR